MRYNEFAPNQPQANAPQKRPMYPVQPDQVRSAIVQRKLAYDIAQSANQVEPTELEKVKAFTRYAEVQKQANANAQKATTAPKQIDSRRTRR